MRVLVIGERGQLAQSLKERGAKQREVELMFAGRPNTDLSIDGNAAKEVVRLRPDVVVNAAAYTNVDRAEAEKALAFRINAQAAGEAAEAAAKIGSPIIQLSTDYVFDGISDRPWREDDPIDPLNTYGASKAAGEEMVRRSNPQHLIIRSSWVVSPFGHNFIKTVVNSSRSRDPLTVVDDQLGRPTSALDLANAILMILALWQKGDAKGLGRTYHVAGSGETSWYWLACEVMSECHRMGASVAEVKPISSVDWPTSAVRPGYSVLDCGRFEADFDWRLPEWRSSTREIVRRLVNSDVP